jgi:REP element-mobilizing transposase RayT
MAHSYLQVYIHYVFSTKNREPLIDPEIESELWRYMAGVAKSNQLPPILINGTEDHVHVLISLPSTTTIAKAIQQIKGASSYWMNSKLDENSNFKWQAGYGAFSVAQSNLKTTIAYIKNQKEHHKTQSFKEEYLELLAKNGVAYNRKDLWR